jgi:hypothetical protein
MGLFSFRLQSPVDPLAIQHSSIISILTAALAPFPANKVRPFAAIFIITDQIVTSKSRSIDCRILDSFDLPLTVFIVLESITHVMLTYTLPSFGGSEFQHIFVVIRKVNSITLFTPPKAVTKAVSTRIQLGHPLLLSPRCIATRLLAFPCRGPDASSLNRVADRHA